MNNNTRGTWRRSVAAASVSLLLAAPLLASAQVSNDPLGRQIVDRIFAQLCARGILKSARCQPPPPAPATLTLVKTVVNDNGGTATTTDFQAKIDGVNVAWGVAQTVTAGAHIASEVNMAGYMASSWGGDCAANGTITLAAGENKTCTITNNDDPPTPPPAGHLIVDKVTQPAESAREFEILASGTGTITGGGAGTTTDATSKSYEVTAGTYSVSETIPAGWMQVSNTCTDVAVAAGATETCVITNAKLPTLTVEKVVVNDNGGTATTSYFALFVDGMMTTSGVATTSTIGAHTVSETASSTYSMSISGDCAVNGSITLAAGDVKTCTITNDDNPPAPPTTGTITVIKVVVNDDEGTATSSDSIMHLHTVDPLTDVSGSPQPGSADGTTYSDIAPGTYHGEETDGPDGYTTAFGGACDSDGFITLAAGESKTCTVTNDDTPPQAEGKLLINEVLYDVNTSTQGAEGDNEWIEIFNGTNAAIDLGGFTVSDNTSTTTLPESTILPSDAYLLVFATTTTADFWPSIPEGTMIVVVEDGIGQLGNGGDRVILRNSEGQDVDGVSWGSDTTVLDPSVPVALDGYSIVRQSPTTDTDTNADWTQTISPTPGS